MMERRHFLATAAAMAGAGSSLWGAEKEDVLDRWQRETDAVKADVYRKYLEDGRTRGLTVLEHLETSFEKVLREARETKVEDVPAVWSVYNMGYLVKTRGALFAIDLVHRRAGEIAPELDFALVTHNHGDHYSPDVYQTLNRARKTVVSNFLDNYGVKNWRTDGGFTRAEKVFRLKDVEVRTSLVDHNSYLIDFTTAFEIRVGGWTMYHTGDCGVADKLKTLWGPPALWTFFPGCGVDVFKAVRQIRPRRLVFGHLWELAHQKGRLTTPLIRAAQKRAVAAGVTPTVALWGDRIS
jgi:L-ascorbate metabolism protein UlaG (beta-lactamase superfamily)